MDQNFFNIVYKKFNIFLVIWHICFALYFSKMSNIFLIIVSIIQILIFLLLIFSRFYKCKKNFKIENDDEEYLFDVINTLFISLNIYIVFLIFSKVFLISSLNSIKDILLSLLFFFNTLYSFNMVIRKAFKTTYTRVLMILLFVIFLGWFSINDAYLIPLLVLILNSLISIDDRKKIVMFLKKKKIGNEFIWNINENKGLEDFELEGKFLIQKILIYLFVMVIYLIIKITENFSILLTIHAFINENKAYEFSKFTNILYKGLDRIILTVLFVFIIYLDKGYRGILNKIFK